MRTIELQLDEQTFERAQQVAQARFYTLEALLVELIDQIAQIETVPDPLLGMFGNEPNLIDQVIEMVMTAREKQGLRVADG